jgi:hypothetical protein
MPQNLLICGAVARLTRPVLQKESPSWLAAFIGARMFGENG